MAKEKSPGADTSESAKTSREVNTSSRGVKLFRMPRFLSMSAPGRMKAPIDAQLEGPRQICQEPATDPATSAHQLGSSDVISQPPRQTPSEHHKESSKQSQRHDSAVVTSPIPQQPGSEHPTETSEQAPPSQPPNACTRAVEQSSAGPSKMSGKESTCMTVREICAEVRDDPRPLPEIAEEKPIKGWRQRELSVTGYDATCDPFNFQHGAYTKFYCHAYARGGLRGGTPASTSWRPLADLLAPGARACTREDCAMHAQGKSARETLRKARDELNDMTVVLNDEMTHILAAAQEIANEIGEKGGCAGESERKRNRRKQQRIEKAIAKVKEAANGRSRQAYGGQRLLFESENRGLPFLGGDDGDDAAIGRAERRMDGFDDWADMANGSTVIRTRRA